METGKLPRDPARIPMGIAGLDEILEGGIEPSRLYLVQGDPGTGKTTLGLQFLLAGRQNGERGLYVTLSETTEELNDVAISHGWSLDGLDVFDLAAAESALDPGVQSTLLHAWELELGETVKLVIAQVERTDAARIVFDSMSELRLLAEDPLRFRRQILTLKQFFASRRITVLLLDDLTDTGGGPSHALFSLCQGVISLERRTPEFGPTRRRLEVAKMRAAPYRQGWHDYTIVQGGISVFPRLIASQHHALFVGEPVQSGVPELDAMLHGGPLRGTCMLLTGAAGTGKSTVALQYVHAAAERGENCAVYEFDERTATLLDRSAKMGLDLQRHIDAGRIILRQVDPVELTPGEFDEMLRFDVERNAIRVVVIDSLSGYVMAMPQEQQLSLKLHELLSHLNQTGVLTVMIGPQSGLISAAQGLINVNHLPDTIALLSFFEAGGHIRKGLAIIKNRGGGHEDTVRELSIGSDGLRVGNILTAFRGILSGTPLYTGGSGLLLETG